MAFSAGYLVVIFIIAMLSLTVQAQDVACDQPLGLRDGSVKDSQITSTGPVMAGVAPRYARLYSTSAWCIASSEFVIGTHYLQIDFLQPVNVTAIEARFGETTYLRSGATTYFVQYCTNTSICQFILQNGGPKEFPGIATRDRSVITRLSKHVVGRYLRIYPLQFVNNPCLRLEVYGCPAITLKPSSPTTTASCNRTLGMSDRRIKNTQIHGRGLYYLHARPQFARLGQDRAWCILKNYFRPRTDYLQIDFLQNVTLTAIATQGYADSGVTQYSFMYAIDQLGQISWQNYSSNSTEAQKIAGSSNGTDIQFFSFREPIRTTKVRIYPLEYNIVPCMRLELYGCIMN